MLNAALEKEQYSNCDSTSDSYVQRMLQAKLEPTFLMWTPQLNVSHIIWMQSQTAFLLVQKNTVGILLCLKKLLLSCQAGSPLPVHATGSPGCRCHKLCPGTGPLVLYDQAQNWQTSLAQWCCYLKYNGQNRSVRMVRIHASIYKLLTDHYLFQDRVSGMTGWSHQPDPQ